MPEINWSEIRDQSLHKFSAEVLPQAVTSLTLPDAVTLFVQKSDDHSMPLRELADIVEADSLLTIELLRYVNSVHVGHKERLNSVKQALSILGLARSKVFLITTGIRTAVRAAESELINQRAFWNVSLQRALFAQEVAALLKTDADTAFAASLLQDFLLPILSNDRFDDYRSFVENRCERPDCLTDFEEERFGWDHATAAASLAHQWRLPADIVSCIRYHHLGLKVLGHPQLKRSPVAAVALSALLPDQLRQHSHGLEQLTTLQEKWAAFDWQKLAQRVDVKQTQLGSGVPYGFPLTRRCQSMLDCESAYEDGTLAISVTA